MPRRAIICGGSIGGLFAATALMKAGWQVDVYERSDVELAGRGAGIVTHDTLIEALVSVGADLTDLGVQVHDRVAFDKSGQRVRVLPYPQVVTSWDRIHQILRRLVPADRYHLGSHVVGYTQDETSVTAQFADGQTAKGDLLVGCDGFRSAIRAQMQPSITPEYSGYVVWRALAHESDLSADLRRDIFDTFAFYIPAETQIIGYPIAGPNNDIRPGHRRYNFVWYVPVPAPVLTDMLTDDSGQTHAISIPPPMIREDVLADMQRRAEQMLPAPFVEILSHSERPFFTPIYDHHAPIMHDGRVALAGDAACVARPHVGMGVTKAAQDALALAQHCGSDIAAGLAAYSQERVPLSHSAYARARQLGEWMLAPDPANADGSANARQDDIMRLTAVTVD